MVANSHGFKIEPVVGMPGADAVGVWAAVAYSRRDDCCESRSSSRVFLVEFFTRTERSPGLALRRHEWDSKSGLWADPPCGQQSGLVARALQCGSGRMGLRQDSPAMGLLGADMVQTAHESLAFDIGAALCFLACLLRH